MSKRFRAEAVYGRDRDRRLPRAQVPGEVTQFFGAGSGERLIFEPGDEEAVRRAASRGPYCVVRLARPVGAGASVETPPAAPPVPKPEPEPTPPTSLEPLHEVVRRRLGGRTR